MCTFCMKDIIQGSNVAVLFIQRFHRCIVQSQMSLVSDGGDGGGEMSEGQRQLCHNVLYDFFHGRITNPVEAGMTEIAITESLFYALMKNLYILSFKKY